MMMKKAMAGVAGTLMLGGLMFGRDLFSYVSTAATEVRDVVKDSVPIEFEIKRARDLLTRIDPEIATAKKTVARQDVEIDDLQQKIAQRADAITSQKAEMLARAEELKSGKSTFLVSSKKYSRDQMESDLKTRLTRVKQIENTQEQEQKLLAHKESAVEANRKKLETMMSAKKTLELQIEDLEARLQTLRVAEGVRNVAVDDSEFNRVRGLVTQLDKELKVREKVVDADNTSTDGLIPIETTSSGKSVLEEVDAYLGQPKPVKADVAVRE